MTQPFVGRVEFQATVDHQTRLTVDPDSPTSTLLISNHDGSRVITLGGPNGNVALPNDLSTTRIFVAGRPGLDGFIQISNHDNSRVITLGGPNGNVALPNDLSATRMFVAGRPDLGGLIRVSDRNGRSTISIDADAREIEISNSDGSRRIILGGPDDTAAYRDALKEKTRERVPLDWATTQNNLGSALSTLGERESSTARLEEAVAAHRGLRRDCQRAESGLRISMIQRESTTR
jgi:hypothetical protein